MKLVHLITSLEGGGTENFLYQLIRFSPEHWTHKVFYLKSDGIIGDRLRLLGLAPQKIGIGKLFLHLIREKPEVLHTLLFRGNQLGRLVGRLAGIKRIISSQRSIDAWQKGWHARLDRFTLRFCNDVVVNSSAADQLVRSRLQGEFRPQLTLIKNGIDLEQFRIRDRKEARAKLFLPPPPVLIGGSLMRLHNEKGADYILPFADKVLQKSPGMHFIVGGVGPLEDSLRVQSRNAPWADRLHWLGWVEDTPTFYAALDFFWSLSREESFPQSLLEATAMGIPWIAPNVGGVSDLIAAGTPGRMFSVGDIQQAAEFVQTMVGQPAIPGPRIQEIREAFSVQRMVTQFYNVLSF